MNTQLRVTKWNQKRPRRPGYSWSFLKTRESFHSLKPNKPSMTSSHARPLQAAAGFEELAAGMIMRLQYMAVIAEEQKNTYWDDRLSIEAKRDLAVGEKIRGKEKFDKHIESAWDFWVYRYAEKSSVTLGQTMDRRNSARSTFGDIKDRTP